MQPQSNTTLVSTFVHWKVGNVCSTGLQRFSKHILSCLKAMFQVQQYTALNQFPTPRKLYVLSLPCVTPLLQRTRAVLSYHFIIFAVSAIYGEGLSPIFRLYCQNCLLWIFILLEDNPLTNSYKIWIYTSFLKNIRSNGL